MPQSQQLQVCSQDMGIEYLQTELMIFRSLFWNNHILYVYIKKLIFNRLKCDLPSQGGKDGSHFSLTLQYVVSLASPFM